MSRIRISYSSDSDTRHRAAPTSRPWLSVAMLPTTPCSYGRRPGTGRKPHCQITHRQEAVSHWARRPLDRYAPKPHTASVLDATRGLATHHDNRRPHADFPLTDAARPVRRPRRQRELGVFRSGTPVQSQSGDRRWHRRADACTVQSGLGSLRRRFAPVRQHSYVASGDLRSSGVHVLGERLELLLFIGIGVPVRP